MISISDTLEVMKKILIEEEIASWMISNEYYPHMLSDVRMETIQDLLFIEVFKIIALLSRELPQSDLIQIDFHFLVV